MKTLGEALRDPEVAKELNSRFRGDAKLLEPAAKAGDIRAQQLREKIFGIMNGTVPSTTVIQSQTKTTTPQAVINVPGQSIASNIKTPAPIAQSVEQHSAIVPQSNNQTYKQNNELNSARLAMEQARTAYTGAETEGVDFETRLKNAIQKKADFFKTLNEKKGQTIQDLNTVDSRMRAQYGESLKEDPFAMRKIFEQEKGSLENRLSQVNAEIKQRQGYLDDIISAGVKAEEARIKVSKLNYDSKKEAYKDLYDRTKDMVDYMDKNYEGAQVEKYKRDFLSTLGYTGVNSTNAEVVSSVVNAKDGTKGGQCGKFVNDITGLKVGDSYQSKLDKMDPAIKTPEPGMVFTMPTSTKYGHIGFILSIKNGIATVKDSNWDGKSEKISTHQIPVSKMTGFQRVESKEGLTPKVDKLSTNQLKEQARNIISNSKTRGLKRSEAERALLEIDINPNEGYYLALLNDTFGKKVAEPPADLQQKASNIVNEIIQNDTQWVTLDSKDKFKSIKWSSIPIDYRERVKKLLEFRKKV